MRPVPGVRVTLVARDVETPYSGMLPGWVAGHYAFDECHIDLGRLARFAGARLIRDEAVGLDRSESPPAVPRLTRRSATTSCRSISARPRARTMSPAPSSTRSRSSRSTVLPSAGKRCWPAPETLRGLRLAVVGGGAGGVELALSAQHRLAGLGVAPLEVALVTREALLPSHNRRVRHMFERIFAERGIDVLTGSAVIRVEPGAADPRRRPADRVRRGAVGDRGGGRARGSPRPGWRLTADGFVAIDENLRSPGDPRVFAAGDVATMIAHPREKAGVYAVRHGPPLAENLRRALAGKRLRRAVPQRRALALIGTGDGHAVASRGPFAAQGAYLWRLKQWIDRRWMRRYRELPEMRRGGRGADALRRLRRQGAGRRARPRHGTAAAGDQRRGHDRPRQPRRRGADRFSRRAAIVADRRFLPRDGRRPVSVRADRRDPCARRHLCDGRPAGDRACDRHAAAGASGDRRARSFSHAARRPRRARAGGRGAGRRPQRRGRRTGARLCRDRPRARREDCCARAGCAAATG